MRDGRRPAAIYNIGLGEDSGRLRHKCDIDIDIVKYNLSIPQYFEFKQDSVGFKATCNSANLISWLLTRISIHRKRESSIMR